MYVEKKPTNRLSWVLFIHRMLKIAAVAHANVMQMQKKKDAVQVCCELKLNN